MAVKFVPIGRDTPYIFPPSIQDCLPEEHLARFVVDIVDGLDLNHLSAAYSGKGSKPYHPAMLVALLFYGYATGVFFSRKLEKASRDSIAFRYVCANTYPDHDTIATFRKHFLRELEALGKAKNLLADTGYYSEANVELCNDAEIAPLISSNREKHNPPLMDRFKEAPPAARSAQRAEIDETSNADQRGQGFRQFLLCGMDSVQGEWSRVCIRWNLKRMHALSSQ